MPLIFGVDHLAFSFAQIAAIGGRVPAFRALRHRAFRWYWLSTSAQASARGMQFFVLGWLVLELTDSVTQLGLVIFLYGVPNLALMLLGGVLADRWERRTLLLVSQGFVSAIDVTVDSKGRLYVADHGGNQVYQISARGGGN